jgi:hypothetical protein
VLQALYFCRPFREKIIQYKIAYNQRAGNLSMFDSPNINLNSSSSSSNDTTNSNLLANSNLSGNNMNGSSGNNLSGVMNSAAAGGNGNSGMNGATNGQATQAPLLKQEHLLNCLAELFYSIVTMKKKKGVVQPKKFIARLRKDNGKC